MKENDIDIGKKISNIRKACNMTQEEFGALFHVTRQTVSNWENEKNYPDLKTLIEISDRFSVSLDKILKENPRMVKTIDQERIRGSFKRQKAVTDFLCGAGTGLIIGGLMAPSSLHQAIVIFIGIGLVFAGSVLQFRYQERLSALFDDRPQI